MIRIMSDDDDSRVIRVGLLGKLAQLPCANFYLVVPYPPPDTHASGIWIFVQVTELSRTGKNFLETILGAVERDNRAEGRTIGTPNHKRSGGA